MLESLHIGATGLHAQQAHINLISNNLANINTEGFKKSRASFSDLMAAEAGGPRHGHVPIAGTGGTSSLGMGTALSAAEPVFENGEFNKTDRSMDVAIRGQGFFEAMTPEGDYVYTRAGSLSVDEDGYLATVDGLRLNSHIHVPADADDLLIAQDGEVHAQLGDDPEPVYLGHLELAGFNNPSGLEPLGHKLFGETEASGQPHFGAPGESGLGELSQGYVETSNVELVDEMSDLILAQRGYQLGARVVQASDQLLSTINELRP